MMMWWFWVLLFAGLSFLLVFAVRASNTNLRGHAPGVPAEGALDIVKKRYARGEINRDQYQELKRDLESVS